MSFAYTPAKAAIARGELNWQEAGADIRALLVMSNTTADTEQDAQFVGDLATLDEYDGANYVRKVLTGQVVNEDDPNNRAEMDAEDATWTSLGVGTRQCVGLVIYKFVTDDAHSLLLFFIDTGGFPFDGNGGIIALQWNAEGLGQLT
jgi:hypothetical protein